MYSTFVKSLVAVASLGLPFLSTACEEHQRAKGTLHFAAPRGPKEELYTFAYNTTQPNKKNWIGLYDDPAPGLYTDYGMPFSKPSYLWRYVEDYHQGAGYETFLPGELEPGYYAVYFFHDDGYEWFGKPVNIYVPEKDADNIKFANHVFESEKKWKRGEEVWDNIGDLLQGKNKNTWFLHGDTPDWVGLTRDDGDFGGSIPEDAEDATVVLWAVDQKTEAGDYIHIELSLE